MNYTGIPSIEMLLRRPAARPEPVLTERERVAVAFACGALAELAVRERFPGPVADAFRGHSQVLTDLLNRIER